MDLEVVQWGNTQGDGTVANSKCQHGPPECKTMMIYACNKYTTTADKHADFIECFDKTLMTAFPKGLPEGTVNTTFAVASLKACATAQGVDFATLDKCSTSSEGAGYFAKEKALTPGHKGVPFISVNGAPIVYDSATLNLVDMICKARAASIAALDFDLDPLLRCHAKIPARRAGKAGDGSIAALTPVSGILIHARSLPLRQFYRGHLRPPRRSRRNSPTARASRSDREPSGLWICVHPGDLERHNLLESRTFFGVFEHIAGHWGVKHGLVRRRRPNPATGLSNRVGGGILQGRGGFSRPGPPPCRRAMPICRSVAAHLPVS